MAKGLYMVVMIVGLHFPASQRCLFCFYFSCLPQASIFSDVFANSSSLSRRGWFAVLVFIVAFFCLFFLSFFFFLLLNSIRDGLISIWVRSFLSIAFSFCLITTSILMGSFDVFVF